MDTTLEQGDFNKPISNSYVEQNAVFHAIFFEVCKRLLPDDAFNDLVIATIGELNVYPDELQRLIDDIAASQICNLTNELPPLATNEGD
jgi:hypothetical protein